MPEITAKKMEILFRRTRRPCFSAQADLIISKFKGESNISIMSVETLLPTFVNGQYSFMLYVYTYDRQLQLSYMGR